MSLCCKSVILLKNTFHELKLKAVKEDIRDSNSKILEDAPGFSYNKIKTFIS